MPFPSLEFLVFFVVLLALIRLIPKSGHLVTLPFFGLTFYAFRNPAHLMILLGMTAISYFAGIALDREPPTARRRKILWISAAAIIFILFFFKYARFFVKTMDHLFGPGRTGGAIPSINIALPIGISFYTFQSLAYVIDVYRRATPAEYSIKRYAAFLTFFPSLISGPLTKSRMMLPQIQAGVRLDGENLRQGFHLFLSGLFKKIAIADNLAPISDFIWKNPVGLPSLAIMMGTAVFGIRLYCDFSGYTDMARGLAKILGIELPSNFRAPYLAKSIREFWSRWHMTLTQWLRDYVYLPLAYSLSRKMPRETYGNISAEKWIYGGATLTTFILCGLWHGAGWNFVLWGFYHGVLLTAGVFLFRSFKKKRARRRVEATHSFNALLKKIRSLFQWGVTMYLVFFGWILFRVEDLRVLRYTIRKFVLFDFQWNLGSFGFSQVNAVFSLLVLFLFIALHLASSWRGSLTERLNRMKGPRLWLVYTIIFASLILLWPQGTKSFLYFQF